MGLKIVKKITMRTMLLSTEQLEEIATKNKGKDTSVLRVYGRVSSSTTAASSFTDNGEARNYLKFGGEFEAINLFAEDAENAKARSQGLILPSEGEYVVAKFLETARKQDPKGSAEFGLEITVSHHTPPKGNKGYCFKYGVKVLGETPTEDSLSLIGAKFGAVVKTGKSK